MAAKPSLEKTPSSSPNAPAECVMCTSKSTLRCARCQSINYCSNECQATDWPCHELLCKKYTEKPPRPSKDHRLGITFPEAGTSPQLIWVYCEEIDDEDEEESYQAPDMRPYFGDRGTSLSSPRPQLLRRSPKLNRSLRNAIELTSRDAFLIDGSTPNQAVYSSASLASMGPVPGDWRGPIVVLRARGIAMDPDAYEDITLDDFRHVMDYFAIHAE